MTSYGLAFCRADGSSLIPVPNVEAETVRLDAGRVSGEVKTAILDKSVTSDNVAPRTTALPRASVEQLQTRPFKKSKSKAALILVASLLLVTAGIAIGAYAYFSKAKAGSIQSIAVMPFVNTSANVSP